MTHVDLVLSPNQSTVDTFLVCLDNYFYLNYFPLKIFNRVSGQWTQKSATHFVEQNGGLYSGAHEPEENFSALSTPFIWYEYNFIKINIKCDSLWLSVSSFYPYFHNSFLHFLSRHFQLSQWYFLSLLHSYYCNINSCLKILNNEDPRCLPKFQDGL